ncbi:MAG: dTDP-4-dehydrorhamnose reductase [Alphaproteobacteria bacterium]
MKTLLFGAEGQLGRALKRSLKMPFAIIATSRAECDLTDGQAIRDLLESANPGLIVNAAAYTAVDAAESNRDDAFAVNATAPGIMAEWAAQHGAALIHYSTDYVFDGSGERPWREDDAPNPINVYGISKLVGDRAVLASGASALILRTAWLYDGAGRNFLNAILRQAETREELRVVADQFGAPTTATVLAEITADILHSLEGNIAAGLAARGGCVNATTSGAVSWHGFAEAIVEEARHLGRELAVRRIIPVSSGEFEVTAERPLNSHLSLERLESLFGIRPTDWRSALVRELKDARG